MSKTIDIKESPLSKRTRTDFSKHQLKIIETDDVVIHKFKIPGSSMYSTVFINCCGVLAVTGDFGNWIFCREFHPSANETVSEQYWLEKLNISSSQNPYRYDYEATQKEIKTMIAEDDLSEKDKEFLTDLLPFVDDEIEYTYRAYRGNTNMDLEYIPFKKQLSVSLLCVFDSFEEICRRLAIDSTTINPESK